MTPDSAASKPDGVPIAAQLALLLSFTLLSAVVLAIIIFIVVPPPQPPLYRLRDVGDALSGKSLTTASQPLVRRVEEVAPALTDSQEYRESRLRFEVADLMHVPLESVRFYRKNPGYFAGFRRPAPVPLSMSGAFRPQLDFAEFFDDFVAAHQRPDGRWNVVYPAPATFPGPTARRIIFWVLGCLLIIGPAAWWFAQRITEPILYFAKAAQRLRRDPRAPPLVLRGARELREAAFEFNEMQVAIQKYISDRTAMLAAISHDLRTPLTRLRFKLENTSPNRDAMLSDLLQMEQMITSILDAVRQESPESPSKVLDLRSLLECVTDEAVQAGGDAVISDGRSLYVLGDVSSLQRLFTNLVENALRYGQFAKVEARSNGAVAVVEVHDSGPGLPDRELEAVFRPFYRSDTARNLDKTNPRTGVGLGLSICRTIARAHGGDVTLERGTRGLIARVTLPLLEDEVAVEMALAQA